MGLGKFAYLVSMGLSSLGACSNETAHTSTDSSEVKIVGGQAVSAEQFPSVIKLVVKPSTGFFVNNEQICTGVIINSETVVAAAHCIKKAGTAAAGKPRYQGITAALTIQGFNGNRAAQALAGWAYPETIGSDTILEEHIGIDLTVIKFAPNTFVLPRYPQLPAPRTPGETIAEVAPAINLQGSEVTLVGYGATSADMRTGAGNKNAGKNQIAASMGDRGYLTVVGSLSKREAVAAKGDSGGPVFASDGTNPDGILLGIGSAYAVQGDQVTNFFVDLSSIQSQALLTYASGRMNDGDFSKVVRFGSTNAGRFEAMCGGGGGGNPLSGLLGGGKGAGGSLPVNSGANG